MERAQRQLIQPELFPGSQPPDGLVYRAEILSREQEQEIVRELDALEFMQVKMHDVVAKRRTIHYGVGYNYATRQLRPGAPMPKFLIALREQLRMLTDIPPAEFVEALVSEYPSGAGIGWHSDAPGFGVVAGISLLSACKMQFRPVPDASKPQAEGDEIHRTKRVKPLVQILAPRSGYLLKGAVRWQWQHHIPSTPELRYSITFRTLRKQ
jgi:alkylated DNA repair protein (DNA oxidative demethylase)